MFRAALSGPTREFSQVHVNCEKGAALELLRSAENTKKLPVHEVKGRRLLLNQVRNKT